MSAILLYGLILFDIIEGKKYIGGPAINASLHLAHHGFTPTLVSCVGADDLGKEAKKILIKNGISCSFIETDDRHDTGWVNVFLDQKGNPTFDIVKPVAYDFISLSESQLSTLSKTKYDIFYFGSVVQRLQESADTLHKVLKNINYDYSFYDINLRPGHFTKNIIRFSLLHTDILKFNEDELIEVSNLFSIGTRDEQLVVDWIFRQFTVKIILLTRGENGVSVFTHDQRNDIDGIKVKVKDTVGSGDAFSAGFIMEFIKSGNLMQAAQKGNELGAYVATKSGAVPEVNEELNDH